MKVDFQEACEILKSDEVLAVPTETVYGLAASIDSPKAIEKIFTIKGRQKANPLIVHVSNQKQIENLILNWPENFKLVQDFWPGPLTVVLPANKNAVPKSIRANLDTVAIRFSNHKILNELIEKVGPIAAPSANFSGRPSATKAKHIENDFGKDFPVLDGGDCKNGVESTIISLEESNWNLLRVGAISYEDLQKALGCSAKSVILNKNNKPLSPGQLFQHYSPKAKLCLQSQNQNKDFVYDAVLGFDNTRFANDNSVKLYSLGPRNSHNVNLQKLYDTLRLLDTELCQSVLVDDDFQKTGLGKTLWDRLCKASGFLDLKN